MNGQINSSQEPLSKKTPAPPKLKKKAQQSAKKNTQKQGVQSSQPNPNTNKPKKKASGKFHNPYNFVPSPKHELEKDLGDLGDFEPQGHKEYLKAYWSGTITCTLTTETPLLISDAAKLTEDIIADSEKEKTPKSSDVKTTNKHNSYPVRMLNGKPYLAPTSIKGMLRNAYEAVTNSRFGVFEEHSDRLAYRMSANNVVMIPARVERSADGLVLRLMKGALPDNQREKVGQTNPYAANLPCYPPKEPKTYPDGTDPQHGDAVWVVLKPNSDSNKVANQEVDKIERRTNDTKANRNPEWKRGWVCITGRNIKNKKYERVFVESTPYEDKPVDDSVKQKWKELIKNYKKAHEKDLQWRKERKIEPDKYRSDKPGQTAWSRHIYTPDAEKLTEGTLCYVMLDNSGQKVKAILPVIISRRLYNTAPQNLLDPSLHPAQKLTELSPSDRLFGWVNQQGTGAYRGQLRIRGVECLKGEDAIEKFDDGLPLGILGEPKPEQVRFYLANKNDEPFEKNKNKNQGYQNGQNLRGRKVYPHQKNVDWEKPTEDKEQNKEYRRPNSVKDTQNRSIEGWIKPETSFKFTLDVVNLSPVELGALLWLLDFNKYQNNEKLYHRLGGGKPFGFGSVQIKIKETDLRLGKSWREFYSSLLPVEVPTQDLNDCVEKFKDTITSAYSKENFEEVEFIAAFIKYAEGFDDNLPVHYPRLHPEAEAENKNYEWFVENEKKSKKEIGQKLPLPALVEDKGLPYIPSKSQSK